MKIPDVPGTAIKIGINAHRGDGPISTAIARATAPFLWQFSRKKMAEVPSHISVIFQLSDGRRVIYEALEGEGFRGPIPMEKVEKWAAEKEKRWVRTYWIPWEYINKDSADYKLEFLHSRLGLWEYNTIQLPRMWLRKRLNIPMRTTPNKVVCSEVGSKMLAPQIDIPMLCSKPSHDYINPFQIEQAIKRLLCKDGRPVPAVAEAYA